MRGSIPRLHLPVVTNYRGEQVPVSLGVRVVAFSSIGPLLWFALYVSGGSHRDARDLVWLLIGILGIFAAGLYDDYHSVRTRGLWRQVRTLARGSVTPGIVKLAAILGMSAAVLWMLNARGSRLALGVLVVAGSANLWNLLDVVPGRCLKAFIPAVVALFLLLVHGPYDVLAFSSFGAALVVLPADLGEVGVLGDGGANLLGFVVGLGLFFHLSEGGLWAALAVILLLHVLSETVTLSRLIEATPPLRWLDRLGRRKNPAPAG